MSETTANHKLVVEPLRAPRDADARGKRLVISRGQALGHSLIAGNDQPQREISLVRAARPAIGGAIADRRRILRR